MKTKSLNEELVLVIEWVDRKFQHHLDSFMNGTLNEKRFFELIEFDERWGFSRKEHIGILLAAKRLGYDVIAAENKRTKDDLRPIPLRVRDNHVVNAIKRIFSQRKAPRVMVVYGEFHLSGVQDNHLKQKLEKLNLDPDLTIYPRSNGKYWEILKRTLNMKKAEVIEFSQTEYFLTQGTVDRSMSALKYYTKSFKTSNPIKKLTKLLKTNGEEPSLSNRCRRVIEGF